jgi:hypothetical protein
VRHGQQPHLGVEQLVELGGIEVAALRIDLPLAQFDAARHQLAPGAGVGLVILVGDDDGVTRLQPRFEGAAERVGVGRGRGAEMDPVGSDVEGHRHAAVGIVHRFAGETGGCVGAVGLDLGVPVIGAHAIEHRRAGVGTAGVLEESEVLEIRLLEGWELGPDARGIERQGHRVGL